MKTSKFNSIPSITYQWWIRIYKGMQTLHSDVNFNNWKSRSFVYGNKKSTKVDKVSLLLKKRRFRCQITLLNNLFDIFYLWPYLCQNLTISDSYGNINLKVPIFLFTLMYINIGVCSMGALNFIFHNSAAGLLIIMYK